ncbi:hypothetical protein Golob_021500, partial [Gossypium lobatum]|nr:hypothetical protein [Gossypium lobatum]
GSLSHSSSIRCKAKSGTIPFRYSCSSLLRLSVAMGLCCKSRSNILMQFRSCNQDPTLPFLATAPNAARGLCLSNAPSKLIFIVVPDRGTQVVISAFLVSPVPCKSSISFT